MYITPGSAANVTGTLKEVSVCCRTYQTGLGKHSYCRNPTGAEQPWCYTDAKLCRTGLCDVSGVCEYTKHAHYHLQCPWSIDKFSWSYFS